MSKAGGPTHTVCQSSTVTERPAPRSIEEHVAQMEVGVDQRLLSCVQRLVYDDELRTKPIENVDEAVRHPVAAPLEEQVDPPCVTLLSRSRILSGHRKSACHSAVSPPPSVEGCDLIDHEPRVVD